MLEPDDPTTESTTAADDPAAQPAKVAAKKAPADPAKKAAKKAAKKPAGRKPAPDRAAAEPAAEQAAAESAEPTAKKPARKRTAKKAATTPAATAEGTAGAGQTAPPAMATAGVLFMAPAEQPRGSRAAAKKTPAAKAAKADADQSERAEAAVEQTPAKKGPAKRAPAKKAAAKKAPAKTTAAKLGQQRPSDEPAPGDVDIVAVEEVEDETAEPEDVREAAIELASGARRRRRRGRRGRGGAAKSADASAEGDEADAADSTSADTEADTEADAEADAGGDAATHRRRRRRRSGEEDDDGSAEPNTVTHVREPKAADDGVKAVKGSTRLEAKRQRRRDGRETTRRRAPILSEAEFLARREAVDRVMALRQTGERTQIAVLEDDILVEHYVTRASATSYVGNVYLGRVQNVLPSMEAAFVDIGKGRNGVLYAGEVNWDAAGLEGKARTIESALKSGDAVLVQVTKDPIGHKGARLTSQVSLPGRFLVYVPGGGMTGISRRLPDTERHRLKSILKRIVPEDAGVIVRTAAEGASEEDLTHDVERLKSEWEMIQAAAKETKSAPKLVHGEPDLATRVVRDVFNEDFKSLIVQGDDAWTTVSEYIGAVAPDLSERLSRHTKDTDLFHDLRVDEQLMKALDRKVWLPSGGSLVIDRTEAMTVIDVNTGKFVGAGGNLEQTVTRNNIEAAEEIVRQLRLRDVGGIVVIDFIDMVLESNRELVLRRLTECLGRDRTKHQVAEVTSLGLVQMTRKRVGEGLLEAFSDTCEVCKGRGLIIHTEPVDKPAHRDEDDRPTGKSKRKRGGKGASSGSPAAELPPASDEQRKAANQAIAAIHRAAAGDQDDDGDRGRVDELAFDLVEAVSATSDDSEPHDRDVPDEPITDTVPDEPIPDTVPDEPIPDTVPDEPTAAAEPASEVSAPRRRRRVASRPAGPPAPLEPN